MASRAFHRVSNNANIVPIILAAGDSTHLGFPQPLAQFGKLTALEIALANCAGLQTPIVVLGHQAATVRPAIPPGVRVVVNRQWRSGQLGSLLAGIRHVPHEASLMLYPVDYPLLTAAVIRRLVDGFRGRLKQHMIAVPTFRRRQGHPVIFAPEMRQELAVAQTAREVVGREKRRVKLVAVGTPAIWQGFGTPAAYRRRLREYGRRLR
jgi:CTP:molybdopterin cytidylyltransferase MocA